MNCANNGVGKKFVIETEFDDALSKSLCTSLITEIIKYILYHKQQLPYTFDRLKYIVTRKRASDQDMDNKKNIMLTNSERLYRVAEEGFSTLEVLFEKTKYEIAKKGKVCEIVLLFGGSPLTPKQVYHIHLPDFFCNHQIETHGERKYKLQLLQSIVGSNQLNEMLLKPMDPTNMYVFIRKDRNSICSDNLNSWFLPKNRFQIPTNGQHFHIKLSHQSFEDHNCACRGFNVFSDNELDGSPKSTKLNHTMDSFMGDDGGSKSETEWYQACKTFKGFKDVYVNGVSISNLWVR